MNDQPATPRQIKKLEQLKLESWPDMTIDEAAELLRDALVNQINVQPLKVPATAMAVGSEGDPIGGRQWQE